MISYWKLVLPIHTAYSQSHCQSHCEFTLRIRTVTSYRSRTATFSHCECAVRLYDVVVLCSRSAKSYCDLVSFALGNVRLCYYDVVAQSHGRTIRTTTLLFALRLCVTTLRLRISRTATLRIRIANRKVVLRIRAGGVRLATSWCRAIAL